MSAEQVEQVYRSTILEARNEPAYKKLLEDPAKGDEMHQTISIALSEMKTLEEAADRKTSLDALTPEVAGKIKVIWALSASGSYKSRKNIEPPDPYSTFDWADFSDQKMFRSAALIAGNIAKALAPDERKKDTMNASEVRELVSEFGPPILYGAWDNMNEDVVVAMNKPGSILPTTNLIITGTFSNTLAQIDGFTVPEKLIKPGGEIGIVGFAPHLVRMMHILKAHPDKIPEGMNVRLFPVRTKEGGFEESTAINIRGILYYEHLASPARASKEPYPYVIHGTQ